VLEVALLIVFPGLMAYAAASDLLTMTIPNSLSFALLAAFGGFALAVALPWEVVALHTAAGALILVTCFAMFAVGWIGGGDAKLAAATAVWLGFDKIVEYLLIACVAGGVLSVAIILFRTTPLPSFALGWTWLSRLHDRKNGVPYGIALAGAALIVYPHSPLWRAVIS
jgi:prepilin peptidase CpaA